jgi:DNA polymerase delta subunit 3
LLHAIVSLILGLEDDTMTTQLSAQPPTVGTANEPEDVAMTDDTVSPNRAPVKKRTKKVVPVGRNGLKKKRVLKTRTTLDAKGFMGKHSAKT